MQTKISRSILVTAISIFTVYVSIAQKSTAETKSKTSNKTEMKTYIIEREIPGAGNLTGEKLKAISQKSCGVLISMGPQIQWIQSYVAGDKIYCIYKAENEELIKEHAKEGGFPANKITQVANIISPATAN